MSLELPLDAKWTSAKGWWLAVEVFSRSSYMYDRNFKRDAYLALACARFGW